MNLHLYVDSLDAEPKDAIVDAIHIAKTLNIMVTIKHVGADFKDSTHGVTVSVYPDSNADVILAEYERWHSSVKRAAQSRTPNEGIDR